MKPETKIAQAFTDKFFADAPGMKEVKKQIKTEVEQMLEAYRDEHQLIDFPSLKDKARLDKLQSLTTEYGKGWILRESTTGRGMRLHQSSLPEATPDIREAIDKF